MIVFFKKKIMDISDFALATALRAMLAHSSQLRSGRALIVEEIESGMFSPEVADMKLRVYQADSQIISDMESAIVEFRRYVVL
jgi:hypothetical protein